MRYVAIIESLVIVGLLAWVIVLSQGPASSASATPAEGAAGTSKGEITEEQARQIAARFVNERLAGATVRAVENGSLHSYPKLQPASWWTARKRWHLGIHPDSDGFSIWVSVETDGSDPRLEHASISLK